MLSKGRMLELEQLGVAGISPRHSRTIWARFAGIVRVSPTRTNSVGVVDPVGVAVTFMSPPGGKGVVKSESETRRWTVPEPVTVDESKEKTTEPKGGFVVEARAASVTAPVNPLTVMVEVNVFDPRSTTRGFGLAIRVPCAWTGMIPGYGEKMDTVARTESRLIVTMNIDLKFK